MLFFPSTLNELYNILKCIFIKATISEISSNTVNGNLNIKTTPHSSPNTVEFLDYEILQISRK